MPWWQGPTVLEALDALTNSAPPKDKPLRFAVQDVYRFDRRRILAGRVESGTVKVGDRLLFSPGSKISTVKSIERWSAPPSDFATAGESIGLTLTEQIFVQRGAIAAAGVIPALRTDALQGARVLAGPPTARQRQDATSSSSPPRKPNAKSPPSSA